MTGCRVAAFEILSEDGPLLAVNKPAGLPTQGVPAAVSSLESAVKDYLKAKYDKPGNVYLGIPHRLDRPVSGVVIFARNSKAAARLAEQFRLRQVRKWYLAVVEGSPVPSSGLLSDWLLKVPDLAEAAVVPEGTPGAKPATLSYRVVATQSVEVPVDRGSHTEEGPLSLAFSPAAGARGQESDQGQPLTRSLVLVELHTGRMHQIRVQFASRGWPIVGDRRYGAVSRIGQTDDGEEIIALHAARLDLKHPIRYDDISLRATLPDCWSAFGFGDVTELIQTL